MTAQLHRKWSAAVQAQAQGQAQRMWGMLRVLHARFSAAQVSVGVLSLIAYVCVCVSGVRMWEMLRVLHAHFSAAQVRVFGAFSVSAFVCICLCVFV